MTISLVTLGRIRCLLGAEELSELPHQRKRCALLVYLAIEREVTRESLYNLFWSDRDEEKARGALKQTMYELRRQLGADWVDPRPDPLTISETVRTDAADFETAVASGDVTAALALYRGDFLREFSLGGSKEFEFWLDRKRAYYSRLHRTARRQRIAELMEAGARSEALLVARQWVELEPRDDEAQHNLIVLLAGTGQRTEALRQYESYERMLAGDQLQPLEETAALITALRAADSDQALLRTLVSAATKPEQQRSYALNRGVRQPGRWHARAIGLVGVSSVAIMALLALVLNGARASHTRSGVVLPSSASEPSAASSLNALRQMKSRFPDRWVASPNQDAVSLYTKGRNYAKRRAPESLADAIQYFEAAIKLDSTYALAWAGLADAYAWSAQFAPLPHREASADCASPRRRVCSDRPSLYGDWMIKAHAAAIRANDLGVIDLLAIQGWSLKGHQVVRRNDWWLAEVGEARIPSANRGFRRSPIRDPRS